MNALIHRDYDIAGAKCQLTVTEDTVTIRSPGRPPEPITVEQLQAFTAPMLSRNPPLHYVVGQMGLAEEQGLGIRTMRDGARKLGLPLPRYTWDSPYVVLTLYRTPEAATSTLDREVLESLSKAERKGWQWLARKRRTSSSEYASAMEIETRTARRHLTRFEQIGLVRRKGTGPHVEYDVV